MLVGTMFMMAFMAALWGLTVLVSAKSAVHEIEAFILFLIASVLFGSFVIASRLADILKAVAPAKTEEKPATERGRP
jgi:hypothetical protein